MGPAGQKKAEHYGRMGCPEGNADDAETMPANYLSGPLALPEDPRARQFPLHWPPRNDVRLALGGYACRQASTLLGRRITFQSGASPAAAKVLSLQGMTDD